MLTARFGAFSFKIGKSLRSPLVKRHDGSHLSLNGDVDA